MNNQIRSGQKIKMQTIDELLGASTGETSEEIEISKIQGFENHPFKVLDDDKMAELVESIRLNGVLSPVLVRSTDEGGYEMISGHRRMHAAKLAGLVTIPAFVRDMTDDEATIAMVDANIQREEILPSERAWSLKMKMDAMKRQGARSDLTCGQNVHKSESETKVRELIGKDINMVGRQVQRYVRLTELIPELLDMVDNKRLQFICAVEISYFDKQIQKWLCEYIHENGVIKPEQIARLKESVHQMSISQMDMICILNGEINTKISKKVTIPEKKLMKFFPPHYTEKQMEDVIYRLLEQWSKEGEANGEV